MSLGDWFRRLVSSRPKVAPESAEEAATVREEYGVSDSGGAPLEQPTQSGGAAAMPGLAGLESAEAAEAEEQELEPPPDQSP
jgi:hypothetical protein